MTHIEFTCARSRNIVLLPSKNLCVRMFDNGDVRVCCPKLWDESGDPVWIEVLESLDDVRQLLKLAGVPCVSARDIP